MFYHDDKGDQQVVIILDATPSMLEEFDPEHDSCDTTKFDVAKYVTQEVVRLSSSCSATIAAPTRKRPRHLLNVVSVILLNTPETCHHFSNQHKDKTDHDSQNDEIIFPNITELTISNDVASDSLYTQIQALTVAFSALESAKILKDRDGGTKDSTYFTKMTPRKGDFLNGIIVGADALFRYLKTKSMESISSDKSLQKRLCHYYQNRIILLTDAQHKVDVNQKQLLVTLDRLRTLNCRLEVVGFGFEHSATFDRPQSPSRNTPDKHDYVCIDNKNEDDHDCDTEDDENGSSGDDDDEEEGEEEQSVDEDDIRDVKNQNEEVLLNLASKLGGAAMIPKSVEDIFDFLQLSHLQETNKPNEKVQKSNSSPVHQGPRNEWSLRPNGSDRIFWNGTDDVSLEEWLQKIRPSLFSTSSVPHYPIKESCEWIQIDNIVKDSSGYRRDDVIVIGDSEEDSVEPYRPRNAKYMVPLNEISSAIEKGSRISAAAKQHCIDEIMRIAKNDNNLVGKWLVYCSPETADATWETIARATASGLLGCSSKIAPTKGMLQEKTVICVYVKDSTDKREVQRVLKVLRNDLVITRGLSSFKPDIFTELDIYSKNKWRLKPTLYGVQEALDWDFTN